MVVGAVPWPAPRARRWRPALLATAVLAGAAAALWLGWPTRGRERAVAPRVAPSTLLAPATTPLTLAAAPVTLPPPSARPEGAPAATGARPGPSPPAAEAAPDAGLRLEAIGERDGRPVAVISSRLVREGDRYDGITVVRIGADEVEIEVQGRRRTLRF